MGAGYHTPDGGDCYHYGEPGEFHVGAGLSQMVSGINRQPMWVTKTKKGRKAFPYNEKRHAKSVNKGMVFPDHSGRFRDKDGNYIYVSKKNPTRYYTHTEHQDHVKSRKGGPNRDQNQKGRQGQKHQNQKKKKSRNERVDDFLIRALNNFKSHVDKSKSEAKRFPDLSGLKEPSTDDFKTSFDAFKFRFDNSKAEFEGRNPKKTWPKDLDDWKFPSPGDDPEVAYREFSQTVSRLKSGIVDVIISTRHYKKSVHESNILAKAIAKANGIDDEITMEELKSMFGKKYEIALHSEQYIFAMLPSRLDGIVTQEYTFETLAAKLTEKKIVDIKTMGILSNNNYKILKQVLKRAKRHDKKVSQPPAPTTQSNESQFRIGSHGLVGMSSAHVY